MRIYAIDPGSEKSGAVEWDSKKEEVISADKIDNTFLLDKIRNYSTVSADIIVCEMIGHYGTGMPAGKTVFDTCVWIGNFQEASKLDFELVLRPTIKAHHCNSSRAKDSNIVQALKDRFEPDLQPRCRPKGKLKGVKADAWQALALAVYWGDIVAKETKVRRRKRIK